MAALEFSARASLDVPVRELWRFLYDTDRLNRSLGLPTVSYVPDPDASKKGHYAAAARLGPLRLRYEEFPFEWVQDRYYRVLRRFRSGPFREITGGVRLTEEAPNRTTLEVFSSVLPRHMLGSLLAKLIIKKMAVSAILRQARDFERGYGERGMMSLPLKPPPVLGPQLEARLTALAASPIRTELLPRLRDLVQNGSDIEVASIRPFEWADRWDAIRDEALRFFLHASRAGLVDLNWEVVCPHCRTAANSAPELSGLSAQASCRTCETTFRADLSASVEAVFSVNPAVRPVRRETFCIGSPARSPRIIGQFRLEPGERREERVGMETGLLTARCYQSPGLRGVEAAAEETNARLQILCREQFAVDRSRVIAGPVTIELINRLPREALVVLEKDSWKDTAATAAAVANIQEFRDLFPEQAVAPGQEIRVGRLAVLFTDLQGSTELYGVVGDVRAFDFIHAHFQFLTACVSRHNGGVVKTIGDAVMAVFPSAGDALQAGMDMQTGWGEFLQGQKLPAKVGLRVGFHEGSAVAFNNKGLLDYFGATVNIAARVEAKAAPGQLVFAASLLSDPDVADALRASGRSTALFTAELKGIAGAQELARLVFSRPA